MPECGYNQIREEALKRQMDAIQDRSTGSLTDEKVAKMCKDDIAEHGPHRHIKHKWSDFLSQQ